MIGIDEALILRLHALELHVGREDQPVDHVVLGACRVAGIIGLVEQAAGGR